MARIVSPIPSVRAEKRSGRGARGQRSMPTLRDLTGRSCLSGAAQQQSEFCGRTPTASIAGCPAAKRRGHGQWGALLLPSFLVRARKEGAPPGAVPGLPTSTQPNDRQARYIKVHSDQRKQIKRQSQVSPRIKSENSPQTAIRLTRAPLPLPLGEGRGEGSQGRAQRWPVWAPTPFWMRLGRGMGGVAAAPKDAAAS